MKAATKDRFWAFAETWPNPALRVGRVAPTYPVALLSRRRARKLSAPPSSSSSFRDRKWMPMTAASAAQLLLGGDDGDYGGRGEGEQSRDRKHTRREGHGERRDENHDRQHQTAETGAPAAPALTHLRALGNASQPA